jgi:MEDS: MEthanogen/methylotroph, DcmR Sensory domain
MTAAHSAHFVQFFDADEGLIEAVVRFVREGIAAGSTCVVIATNAHREQIAARLEALGLEPERLAAAYRYISIDAHLALQSFMGVDGPDQQRFHHNMGLLLRQAAARGQPVHVFGEMVAILAMQGRARAAILLEELWNELSRYHTFRLFCGYPVAAFESDMRSRAIVCANHSHVVPAE